VRGAGDEGSEIGRAFPVPLLSMDSSPDMGSPTIHHLRRMARHARRGRRC
jgi:hypothetical protein